MSDSERSGEHNRPVPISSALSCSPLLLPSLRITAPPVFEFNASHFTAENLYAAKHTTDLAPRAGTIVGLDAAHRGLGTQSC